LLGGKCDGEMKIYNTQTRRKEEFKPGDKRLVRIYVCGPTVYDHSHIGHGRVYVVYDVLERYLRYKGYDVMKAMNITDIDDKMIKRANELNISVKELAEVMSLSFLEDLVRLNVLLPEFIPRATHHIQDMMRIIEKLIENGYAYVADGDVYFDVSKFDKYGELSKQSIEDLIAGRRVEPSEKKRNPLDFALWKAKKPGEPYWESPWGEGRPGWHIECSAMSMKLLGETIDIHGGAQDLIFPHHENEKAQSEAATGNRFVRYWMHCGLLTVNKEEMSKSKGNVVSLKEVLDKYGSDALRIMYLGTHYRSMLEFTWDRLDDAKNTVERIKKAYENLQSILEKKDVKWVEKKKDLDVVEEYRKRIMDALDDDLNTPVALSEFLGFIRWVNKYAEETEMDRDVVNAANKLFRDVLYIFGLKLVEEKKGLYTEELIKILISVRQKLREEKNFELADYIRDELKKLGIELEDRGKETRYYIK